MLQSSEYSSKEQTRNLYRAGRTSSIHTYNRHSLRIPPHHTIFLTPSGEQLAILASEDADVLLLSGEPIRETIASQGRFKKPIPISSRENGAALGSLALSDDDEWS